MTNSVQRGEPQYVAYLRASNNLYYIAGRIEQFQEAGLLVTDGYRTAPAEEQDIEQVVSDLHHLRNSFTAAWDHVLRSGHVETTRFLAILSPPKRVVDTVLDFARHHDHFGASETLAGIANAFERLCDHVIPLTQLAARLHAEFDVCHHTSGEVTQPSVVADPPAIPSISGGASEKTPRHAPDFSWVLCELGEFTFSTNQRPVIRALWADWEEGGLGLGQSYLLDLAGADTTSRLRDLFKKEPALDLLIVRGDRKDTFRLALPSPT